MKRGNLAYLRLACRCMGLAIALLLMTQGSAMGQPAVVISQVFGGGGNTGAPWHNDYIELFNRGTTAQDLTGWSVQYASVTGSTWTPTNLGAFMLQPGQYYLIQEGAGTGGGAALPTPDATGAIAMSSANGKVALSNGTTALTGTCPTGAAVIDLIGFGPANCFETAPTAVLSNTTAAVRNTHGCDDINNNSVDFTVASTFTPRNTATPTASCTATGACCDIHGNCTITTLGGCGGNYQGDNTNCNPNPCPPPLGACCTSDTACTLTGPGGCAGGSYLGDGTTCAGNGCCYNLNDAKFVTFPTAGARTCTVTVATLDDTTSDATRSFTVQDLSGSGASPAGLNRGATIFGAIGTPIDTIVGGLALGDTIRLTNITINQFSGLIQFEVNASTTVTHIGTGTAPAPIPITAQDLGDGSLTGEDLESTRVTLQCVAFVNPSGNFAGGINYLVRDGVFANSVIVRVPSSTSTPPPSVIGTPIPSGMVSIRGVFSQFDNNAANGLDDGYEVLLFNATDILPAGCTTGACCAGDGTCRDVTQDACSPAGVGGVFKGNGTTCATLNPPCPNLAGACCVNGACLQVQESDCTTQSGTFTSIGTPCDYSPNGPHPYPCPNTCASLTVVAARALADALPNPTIAQVRLCHVVVNTTIDTIGSAANKNFRVQDNSGPGGTPRGITIFGTNDPIDAMLNAGVVPGSLITLQGATNRFNGEAELDATQGPLTLVSIDGFPGVPAPTPVTLSMLADNAPEGEALESIVVRTNCLTFVSATGNFAAGTNYNVTDGVSTVIARVGTADLDMVGTPIPTGKIMLIGVVDQFDSNAANGLDDGYEIQLLSLSGIICCCPGDMDFSGTINLNDTSLFINALLGPPGIICADMNGDGKMNGKDVKGFTDAVIANGGAGTTCPP